ncbi:MAG: cytochrome c oxidase subunit 3 [Alphaproteobacteria bacterium]|nr:cytochrome c oxidase subunit 3 [Alphaproteobacteria bacterium]
MAADGHTQNHDYHLVNPSPWPLTASFFALIMAFGAIIWMRTAGGSGEGLFGITGPTPFFIGLAGIIATAFFWWRDCIREAHGGDHSPVVQLHLRYGMLMFIASEVMFFVAWFWAYFDASLYPGGISPLPIYGPDGTVVGQSESVIGMVQRNELTGGLWPPKPSENFQYTFDPWGLPLVNTLILLLSGTTVTWAHHALLHNDRKGLIWGLTLTVILGVLFTVCQVYEYGHAAFSFSGHIYGATFFMATGFHGFHVIVGTIFLFVCLMRAIAGHFTPKQHFGFEAAAWYWHFVDVVWLFLFLAIYVYGAGANPGGV